MCINCVFLNYFQVYDSHLTRGIGHSMLHYFILNHDVCVLNIVNAIP
jgi:hypothetical protein